MTAHKRPKVVKFGKPKIADDTKLVASLVAVLADARAGKIKGFAVVFLSEVQPGTSDVTMSADILSDIDRLVLLGGIERLKAAFMAREWPE